MLPKNIPGFSATTAALRGQPICEHLRGMKLTATLTLGFLGGLEAIKSRYDAVGLRECETNDNAYDYAVTDAPYNFGIHRDLVGTWRLLGALKRWGHPMTPLCRGGHLWVGETMQCFEHSCIHRYETANGIVVAPAPIDRIMRPAQQGVRLIVCPHNPPPTHSNQPTCAWWQHSLVCKPVIDGQTQGAQACASGTFPALQQNGSVLIQHQPIDNSVYQGAERVEGGVLMPAMTMPFPLDDGVTLDAVAMGDQVEFVVEVSKDDLTTGRQFIILGIRRLTN